MVHGSRVFMGERVAVGVAKVSISAENDSSKYDISLFCVAKPEIMTTFV